MKLTRIFNGLDDWPKASRTTNPASSHEAERGVTTSGARTTNATLVLNALSAAGTPLTAWEIADRITRSGYDGFNRDVVGKRLYDLKKLGQVRQLGCRKCRITDRKLAEWEVC